jgi:N4-gp56 family major capsid protein
MARIYDDPAGGSASSIGPQKTTEYWSRKSLIDLVKEQYFLPLADVTAMPKHFGKKIKQFHYLPLLDERNINDQGINAEGTTLVVGQWSGWNAAGVLTGAAYTTEALARTGAGAGGTVAPNGGNLYGSSKDIGVISAKLPALSETGGRVNRVGFKRIEIEGTIEKFGFFDEYTQDSLDFDSDDQLQEHIHREMLRGAHEMTEDALQVDLLNQAGTVRYCGNATQNSEMSGVALTIDEVSYDDLMRFSIDLDNNRTPKHTKIIAGSRMVDTRVIDSARILYIGSELIPTVRNMKDLFGNQAFIPVAHYASAGNILNGEIGTLDQFRIVVVPEMLHWAGVGADEGVNAGYRATNGKYDVHPMLCVGDGSFTTIGFQTDGKTFKFKIFHKAPGKEMADLTNPFGEVGFMSIKWWYGTMILRGERLGLVKTVARV